MAAGTLYTYPDNWRAFKALIAAQYSGFTLRVDTGFVLGQTNRSGQFLAKFPLGKVPAFEGDDGFCVFESNAIAHYVANDELRGVTHEAAAQVQQWISFADSDVIPPASTWVFPTLGIMQYNKQATEHAKEEVKKVLGILNEHLKTRTYLVGERITLADISLVCSLLWLYKQVLEPSFRQSFTNTNRWFVTCVNQPQFKAVLGQLQLCNKMAQFDAKKFAELQPKKEKAPKEPKEPKCQEKKKVKEEKKPAAPEEEQDASDEVLSSEPKAKDPFAHLPKSPFIMDEFKRKYSNEDTLSVALPHFWEHFDKEGWSIWYSEYKYPTELTLTFMSCNLISGMFQRLDKLRKNAFASVILFGSNNDSSISGIWVFRGQELAFPSKDVPVGQRKSAREGDCWAAGLKGPKGLFCVPKQEVKMSPDWQVDYESYSWRKLDSDSEECRTMVKEYFSWEGQFTHVGKPFKEGKIFK